MQRNILFSIFGILLLVSCSRNPVTGKKEVMLMSEGQEIAMGQESDPAIVAEFGLYENPALQNLLARKGAEIAAISHRPNLSYNFRVLDSPVVNAFAVPGGYVYFTRGILAHFNNEAELAGVLGHEIGHITAKHSAKQYSNQLITQILFIGGLVVSEDFRKFADVAQQGMGLLFLKFSRDHEKESDKLGVEYSTKIGYDAHEMGTFFKTLKKLSGGEGAIPTFLSTHPDPGDREVTVNKLATEAQTKAGTSNFKVERNEYLKLIDGIVYGEDPQQGYVENSVFYHPDLKFKYQVPNGWKTVNTPAQVNMAPADGKALLSFSATQGTLADVKNKTISENNLQVVEQANTMVNGMNAISMLSNVPASNQNGQQTPALTVLTYLIEYNGLIYKFHGLSTQTDFNAYFSTFQTSMKSFSVLSDQAKINKQPMKIKIVTANKSASLQQLLTENGMPSNRLQELSILNGMELSDTVNSGTLFKVLSGGY